MSKSRKATGHTRTQPNTKTAKMIQLMRRKNGATLTDLIKATGWQAHSVRGAISGKLNKKMGLQIMSETVDGRGRTYRIADAT